MEYDQYKRWLKKCRENGLNVRAANVLANMDINSLDRIWELDDRQILKQKNCGKATLAVIRKHFPKSINTVLLWYD